MVVQCLVFVCGHAVFCVCRREGVQVPIIVTSCIEEVENRGEISLITIPRHI